MSRLHGVHGRGRDIRVQDQNVPMPALFVNAYDVRFEGEVTLWRLARREGEDKHEVARAAEVELWADDEAFWAAREPSGRAAESVSLATLSPRGPVLFAARDALVDHAHQTGREAWFGRGGEMHFLGLSPSQAADPFVVEPELVMRLVQEEFVDSDAVAVVRARSRWRSRDTLADRDVARHAVGEYAVRVSSEGPRRGRSSRWVQTTCGCASAKGSTQSSPRITR